LGWSALALIMVASISLIQAAYSLSWSSLRPGKYIL
jgi:hypothetical protein